MSLTARLSQLILSSQPDSAARQRAREGMQDFLAVSWPVLARQVPDSGLPRLQGLYRDRGAASRALLLGYAGHALDYDDFHADFRGHPSVVILPALLAWTAESGSFSLTRFLDAYVVGVEMAGRLGLAMTQRHYTLGYHNTASLGTLAAAAALAHFTGANSRQTAVLLGIAATDASGLRAQFGSAVKPLHAGLAAERAVRAAQLALAGFDGQEEGVLESFIALASADEAQSEKLSDGWGTPWRIVTPGLEFKPFATCAGTHSAAEAAREIRQRWTGSSTSLVNSIDRITVAFPPGGDIAASVRQPQNGIEARFSLEYVIAAMLIYGDLRMADFAEGDVNPQIMALAAKVTRQPDEQAPPDALNPALRFHEVTLFLNNGETLNERRTRQQSLATPVNVAGKLQAALADYSELFQHSRLADDNDLREVARRLTAAL
ncbi:2-methylcitrate dehydratase [Candidatus Pantoea deserta]|uniref:2-methylcitrate dehydratase n=1 Tax=Candidatus Pantoea deserta TaxID=1869313 RepID=A0A3N4NZX2_9GAMM|nr:MmgE/PrpD family protein [Pantoea deserta]RPD99758.1 2-methylcitrate dehydratase [Pantoea deserta]